MDSTARIMGQYRTHDPPKNFCARVTVKKVVDSGVISAPQLRQDSRTQQQQNVSGDMEMGRLDADRHFEEAVIVRWQEKIFSRKEFDFYGVRDNCLTSLEEKYHGDILLMRERGIPPSGRIFTYLDADDNRTKERDQIDTMTLSPNERSSHLVQRMAEVKLSHYSQKSKQMRNAPHRFGNIIVDNPTEAMKQGHVLTTPCRSMQIMLDLNDPNGLYSLDNEHVLCYIKLDANGQMTMKPDFTTTEPYHLELHFGGKGIYDYTIEHCSDVPPREDRKREESLYHQLYNRHAEIMASKIGTELKPEPKEGELIVHLLGEIVSASNFEFEDIYVQYFLDLPQGWTADGLPLLGVTQRCRTKNGMAHFSSPFDCHLVYTSPSGKDGSGFIEWPTLYLEVCSLDSWLRGRTEGYGYCVMPDSAGHHDIVVDSWRPAGDGPVSEMRRFFTGGGAELVDTTYTKVPAGTEGRALSKFFFRTIPSGSIRLRIYTLLQYRNFVPKLSGRASQKSMYDQFGPLGPGDGLTSVLDAFQKARKRLLEARAALPALRS